MLQSARLFKDCPEAEVRALVRGAQRQRCLSGKVIAMEGDVLPGVFFVHRGRCTVYKNLAPPHHPHGSGLARPDTRHSLRSTRGRSHATAGSGKAPSPKLQPEAAVGMSVLQRMADAREASAAGANGQDSQVRCVGERRRRAQRGAHVTPRGTAFVPRRRATWRRSCKLCVKAGTLSFCCSRPQNTISSTSSSTR